MDMTIIAEIDPQNLRNQDGFTLLEVGAVLVIIAILSSTTIYRYYSLSDSADSKVLSTGMRELNIRETLIWTQYKISPSGWPGDRTVYDSVDKFIGDGFYWNPAVQISGGSLHYNYRSVDLTRSPSTPSSPAKWDNET